MPILQQPPNFIKYLYALFISGKEIQTKSITFVFPVDFEQMEEEVPI